MEYAADIIQAEQEAYFARERAKEKGIKGFQNKGKGKSSGSSGRAFHVSGQLTLQERQQKIQNLKSCKVGHWSGDASCPKSKGKGKSPEGSGKKGKRSGDTKPRTVFFALRENERR